LGGRDAGRRRAIGAARADAAPLDTLGYAGQRRSLVAARCVGVAETNIS
jgi:hypothetical protein